MASRFSIFHLFHLDAGPRGRIESAGEQEALQPNRLFVETGERGDVLFAHLKHSALGYEHLRVCGGHLTETRKVQLMSFPRARKYRLLKAFDRAQRILVISED
jgi:hypothetical protein